MTSKIVLEITTEFGRVVIDLDSVTDKTIDSITGMVTKILQHEQFQVYFTPMLANVPPLIIGSVSSIEITQYES